MSDARKAPEHAPTQGAQDEPWWAEAVQAVLAGEGIRSVARRFGTHPRRIRRALARVSIRAQGKPAQRGLPALGAVRGRLGTEPDGVLARVAGVTPQTIAGERYRLGIQAFKPTPRGSLTPAESAWVRGPERRGRIKPKKHDDVVVVHRVVRPELNARNSRGPSVIRRPVPVEDGSVALEPAASIFRNPRGVQTIRAGDGTPVVLGREESTSPEPPRGTAPTSGLVRMRTELISERQREIDELLSAPKHDREGRQRIVRTESARLIEPTPLPAPTQRRRPENPAWRSVPDGPELRSIPTANAESPVPPSPLAPVPPPANLVFAKPEVPPAPAPRPNGGPAVAPPAARQTAIAPAVAPPAARQTAIAPAVPRARPATAAPARSLPSRTPAVQLSLGFAVPRETQRFLVWCTMFGAPIEVDAEDLPGALAAAALVLDGFPTEITAVQRS